MSSDKGKNIQNYVLEDKLFSLSDQSEFYAARHKILKKTFTLRKIKASSSSEASTLLKGVQSRSSDTLMQQLNSEVTVLKHLNGVGAPRCHKLIKTENHIYMVYDEFPDKNLKTYLGKTLLTKSQKLDLMIKLAKTLSNIHQVGVIVSGFNIQTILVTEDGSPMFIDMRLASILKQTQAPDVERFSDLKTDNLPPEYLQEGIFGFFTDVFILGSMFKLIARSLNKEKAKNINKTIENMIKVKPHDRFSLDEIIADLQAQKNSCIERKESCNEPCSPLLAPPSLHNDLKPRKYSMDQSNKERQIDITPKYGGSSRRLDGDQFIINRKSPPMVKKITSRCSISTKDGTCIQAPTQATLGVKTLSTWKASVEPHKRERSRSARSVHSAQYAELSRKVNKKRNLAFFIHNLSEFVIEQWICPQLGFLLLKYSTLTLDDALRLLKVASHPSEEHPEYKYLFDMLTSESQKMKACLAKMKIAFAQMNPESSLTKQLEEEEIISERYLQEKIIEFGLQILQQLQKPSKNGKRTVKESTNMLFPVYMMLKKVEHGSFEKFWDKIYNNQFASLSGQRYMLEEKQLGYRYVKSKVTSLLKAK